MINLLIGKSGSGKSYEACVYHILEAVKRGRKVVTNMPLNIDYWHALDPAYFNLIELRKKPLQIKGNWTPTREEGAFSLFSSPDYWLPPSSDRVFASVWDYYDEWRHPETGQGPLFVIDEAQNVIPYKNTDQQVEEWTALHRHWVCDVLYLTQSYGKLSQAIRDNSQIVYRFTKKVAWGQPDRYIRKVQDGVRGEVLNVGERHYEARYFPLYRSHTQGESGSEAMADDIRPWWRHWTYMGAAICVLIFLGMLLSGYVKNPLEVRVPNTAHKPPQKIDLAQLKARLDATESDRKHTPSKDQPEPEPDPSQDSPEVNHDDEPLAGRGVHIIAHVHNANKDIWRFSVSQNGQAAFQMGLDDLLSAGYQFQPMGDCMARITYGEASRVILCDAPAQQVHVGGTAS